jgi:hypothetical protein
MFQRFIPKIMIKKNQNRKKNPYFYRSASQSCSAAAQPSRADMLDINLLRADKGGNPKLVRESLRRRFAKVELVDDIIDLDQAWRTSKNLLSIPSLNPCTSPTGLWPQGLSPLQDSSNWTKSARSLMRPARRLGSSKP